VALIIVNPLGNRRQVRIVRWELEGQRLLTGFPHVLEESPHAVESLKGTIGGGERLRRRVLAVWKLEKFN